MLATLHDPSFNYCQSAILEETLPESQQAELANEPTPSHSKVTITGYKPQEVDISVDSQVAGLLILSDAYYPGWEATLDGDPVQIYRADSTMRGVFIPAGTHELAFRFRPTSWPVALIIAGASLLMGIVLIVVELLKRRASAMQAHTEEEQP